MKLGVITDEVTQKFYEIIEFAKLYSLDGIELRTVEDTDIYMIPTKRIKEMSRVLMDEGLEVCGFSSSFYKCLMDDPGMMDREMEKLKRLAERAHIMGTKIIRGFSFIRQGDFDDRIEDIVEKFYKPIQLLEKEDITLVLESDPTVFTTNSKKLVKLIKKINHPNIRAVYDPGNLIFDPDKESPFPQGLEYIKDYIAHVHIKDAIIEAGKPKAVKVGTGLVPYKDIFNHLCQMWYNGYIVLETHYRINAHIPEELIQLPGGSQFSYMGYASSKESMESLINIIKPYWNRN